MRFFYSPPGPNRFRRSLLSGGWVEIHGYRQHDSIVDVIRETGSFYQRDLLEHLYCSGLPDGVIVDTGANIGNHTVFFARYLASLVLSIEPNRAIAEVLRRNIASNELANVLVLPCAAGACPELAVLKSPNGAGDNGTMETVSASGTARTGPIVEVRTLDELVLRVTGRPVSLLKIGAEGKALRVLSGAEELLNRYLPDIVIEAHTVTLQTQVIEMLRPWGYTVLGIFCEAPTMHLRSAARIH